MSAADMQLDALQDEHISYLLGCWHHWCLAERASSGYPSTAAGFGMWRASRQYDLENGSLDAAADNAMSRAVDGVIHAMPDPWRSALHMEARCLATARVWRSARVDQADAERIVREAREMLWMGMEREGLA